MVVSCFEGSVYIIDATTPEVPGPLDEGQAVRKFHAQRIDVGEHVYCLPLLHGDDQLRFAPWRPGDPLVTNRFGIPEPDVEPASGLPAEALAMAVMPLVGFDDAGRRLGMGGGWYDRAFAFRQRRAAPPWLVGAAFAAQQVPALDAAGWDVLPDAICTERDTFLPRREPRSEPA